MATGGLPTHCTWTGQNGLNVRSGATLANHHDQIARCFHRILAKHTENFLTFNIRQKAFRSGDGTAESVWFLQQLIQKYKSELSLLNIAFLDVKKAFNSVSHQSIILAAKRFGAPPPLLSYLTELYSDAWTTIYVGGERSGIISSG